MGEKSAPSTNIKNEEKKRTVFIPKTRKGDDYQFLGVNGESIRVKKGVPVELPDRFAHLVDNMLKAKEYADSENESYEIE